MTKSPAELDADIAESLRARKWQEQIEREDRDRRARIAAPGPAPDQLYEEHQADLAAGVFHGERRGRAKAFRKITSPAEALRASETAKRLSDDAAIASQHREAAAAHARAARLHRSDPAGAATAWLHDLAASNHRQAAKLRSSKTIAAPGPKTRWTVYMDKLSAASEHDTMAKEYARQSIAEAKKR